MDAASFPFEDDHFDDDDDFNHFIDDHFDGGGDLYIIGAVCLSVTFFIISFSPFSGHFWV